MPSNLLKDQSGMADFALASGPFMATGSAPAGEQPGNVGKARLAYYRKWYHQLDRKRSELQEAAPTGQGAEARVLRLLEAEMKCLEELMVVSTELVEIPAAAGELSATGRLPSKGSMGHNGVDAWPGEAGIPPVEGLDLSLVTDMLLLSTTSPWVVYVADRTTWNICYVSPSLKRFLGYRQSELVGQKAWDSCHADDVPSLNKMLSESDSGSKSSGVLFRRLKRDRSYCLVQAVGRALGQRWFAWMELVQDEEGDTRASPRPAIDPATSAIFPTVNRSTVRPGSPSALVKSLRRISSSNRDPSLTPPESLILPPISSKPRDVYASLDLPSGYPILPQDSKVQASTLDLSALPPNLAPPIFDTPLAASRPSSPYSESTQIGTLDLKGAGSPLRGAGLAGPSGRALRSTGGPRRPISRGPSQERLDVGPLTPSGNALATQPVVYAMSESAGGDNDYLLDNFDFNRRRSVAQLELEEQALGLGHPKKTPMAGGPPSLPIGREDIDTSRRAKSKSPSQTSPETSHSPLLAPELAPLAAPPTNATPLPMARSRRTSAYEKDDPTELVLALNLQPGTKPKVLLVEDDVVNRMVGQRLLESLECQVTVTCNGKEALEIMKGDPESTSYLGVEGDKPPFDLVLMDLLMPVMDGLRAVERYRQWESEQQPRMHRMLIFALTGNVTDGDMVKCAQSGFDEFVSKPLTVEKLLHRLNGVNKAGAARLQPDFTLS